MICSRNHFRSEVTTKEVPQEGERRIEVEFDAEPQLMIGYHKPTIPNFDDYVLDMISAILSDGRTSRFYKNIVEEGIAVSANSINGYPGARYDNLFVVNGTPRSPNTTLDVEEAIYAELERLKTEPVAERNLNASLSKLMPVSSGTSVQTPGWHSNWLSMKGSLATGAIYWGGARICIKSRQRTS